MSAQLSIPQLSHDLIVNSQQIKTAVLRGLGNVNQGDVAKLLSIDDSQLSRFKEGVTKFSFDQLCTLLSAINLTTVEKEGGETVTISRDEYRAMRFFAKRGIDVEQWT